MTTTEYIFDMFRYLAVVVGPIAKVAILSCKLPSYTSCCVHEYLASLF